MTQQSANEPVLTTFTLTVCSECLAGQGDECHTPGCAFWMCSVPSDDVANVLLMTAVPGVVDV